MTVVVVVVVRDVDVDVEEEGQRKTPCERILAAVVRREGGKAVTS